MKKIYIEFYIAGDCVLALPKTDIPDASDVQRNKELVAKMHNVTVDLVYVNEREVEPVDEDAVARLIDTIEGVSLLP